MRLMHGATVLEHAGSALVTPLLPLLSAVAQTRDSKGRLKGTAAKQEEEQEDGAAGSSEEGGSSGDGEEGEGEGSDEGAEEEEADAGEDEDEEDAAAARLRSSREAGPAGRGQAGPGRPQGRAARVGTRWRVGAWRLGACSVWER